jgi:hypothetical protein
MRRYLFYALVLDRRARANGEIVVLSEMCADQGDEL